MLPSFLDVNPTEWLLLFVIAIVVIGPKKLPEYAQKLAQLIKRLRMYAEGARSSLRDQMGPEFDDIDWKAYDPRQYDPRRIVREALLDDDGTDLFGRPTGEGGATSSRAMLADAPMPAEPVPMPSRSHRYDPTYTPYDVEAT